MIRHKALVPLSHDHHQGLMAAQRLKRGDAAYRKSTSITESVAELWNSELTEHFEQEERFLFAIPIESEEVRAMIGRAVSDHRKMRTLVEKISRGENVESNARELGSLLESHIRFEERELFERLQSLLSDDVLDEVGAAMDSIRTPRSCSNDDPGH